MFGFSEGRNRASLEPTPGSRLRVLLVEDDEGIQRTFGRRLERANFDVAIAGTVAQARCALEDDAAVYDAAVLDFDLPDGETFDLVTRLLDREPLCRSLVVTGLGREAEARRYMQLGAHGFLRKPVRPSDLVTAVTETAFATLAWRHRTGQGLPLPTSKGAEPPPVPLDLVAVMDRLAHIATLSPLQSMVAYRLLWGDSDREVAQML
jgi:ActR/RegA family two-component response regulator